MMRYVRERRGVLIAFGTVCAVFGVSFALYHLPVTAVGYPAGLCLIAGLIWAAWDSRRLRRRHEQLQHLAAMGADM